VKTPLDRILNVSKRITAEEVRQLEPVDLAALKDMDICNNCCERIYPYPEEAKDAVYEGLCLHCSYQKKRVELGSEERVMPTTLIALINRIEDAKFNRVNCVYCKVGEVTRRGVTDEEQLRHIFRCLICGCKQRYMVHNMTKAFSLVPLDYPEQMTENNKFNPCMERYWEEMLDDIRK